MDSASASQLDYIAPSGNNVSFHPQYLEQCTLHQQSFKDLSNNSRVPRKASAVIYITNGDVLLEDLATFRCLAF